MINFSYAENGDKLWLNYDLVSDAPLLMEYKKSISMYGERSGCHNTESKKRTPEWVKRIVFLNIR